VPSIENKDQARRELRARRRAFVNGTGIGRLRIHAIVISRITMEAAGNVRNIACYLANAFEVDAMPIVQLACASGLSTALPHISEPGGTMRFLSWRPGDRLVTGPYGIPQPAGSADEIIPDAIVSPLVGFDRQGNRLGQGGGFYDRAFMAYPSAKRIGLAWSVQEIATLPVDSWDQPLHAVVTERERIDF